MDALALRTESKKTQRKKTLLLPRPKNYTGMLSNLLDSSFMISVHRPRQTRAPSGASTILDRENF